jgi:(2Fe-2S) ferredoxin
MSIFKVKLNNGTQGLLDNDPNGVSIQRGIYVPGPDRVSRELKDGEVFSGSNYWKRYVYPNASADQSFLILLEDDGSIWYDKVDLNNIPKVYKLVIESGSSFEDNVIDIQKDTNSFADFIQLSNQSEENPLQIRINGLDSAIFDLAEKEVQSFNNGELNVQKIEALIPEGYTGIAVLQVILSIVVTESTKK